MDGEEVAEGAEEEAEGRRRREEAAAQKEELMAAQRVPPLVEATVVAAPSPTHGRLPSAYGARTAHTNPNKARCHRPSLAIHHRHLVKCPSLKLKVIRELLQICVKESPFHYLCCLPAANCPDPAQHRFVYSAAPRHHSTFADDIGA